MLAKPFSWSRIRRRFSKAWPMNLFGCKAARSWIAPLILKDPLAERRDHEIVLVDHARHFEQRYPAGVAFQGRAQCHAVLLAAGGRDLYVFLRPAGGGIAAHCWRPGLGRVLVCRNSCAEPDLGA